MPEDGSSFQKLLPNSEFESIAKVLDTLGEKAIMAMEFLVLFEDSYVVSNLVWALR